MDSAIQRLNNRGLEDNSIQQLNNQGQKFISVGAHVSGWPHWSLFWEGHQLSSVLHDHNEYDGDGQCKWIMFYSIYST